MIAASSRAEFSLKRLSFFTEPALNKESAKLEQILKRSSVNDLKCYPVSKLVNQVGNNKKECMELLKDGND